MRACRSTQGRETQANIKLASEQTVKQPVLRRQNWFRTSLSIKIVLGLLLITKWWRLQPIMCVVWIIDKLSSSTNEVPDDASKAGAAVTGDSTLHWLSVVSPQIEWIPTSCITTPHSSFSEQRIILSFRQIVCNEPSRAHMWVLARCWSLCY